MYVSRTGNTQRLAVCIYQSLQQLGNGDIEEINCNTEPGKSHLLYVGFCVEKGDCPIEVQELLKKRRELYSRPEVAGRSHCLEPADSGRVRNTMTELWKM